MSLQPQAVPPVPEQTALVARAAFPKGNLYTRLRDELGAIYSDQDFAVLFPRRGQPALSPWRLALVTVFQFVENLSDRQAAEAVRARIDWKYALSLELTDPGFDHSVLCEFRSRLVEGQAEQKLLDRMLAHLCQRGLLKARGKQRTDSTHVLAAIRVMNRIELVTETLRAALNELAEVAPDWLRSFAPADWYTRYSSRAEQSRLPSKEPERTRFAEQVGTDGLLLLDRLRERRPDLLEVPKVQTLRLVWERHFATDSSDIDAKGSSGEAGGKVSLRESKDLARAATAIESPYDTEARHSTKGDICWSGYKAHLSESCEAGSPRLVTNVHTTVATTQDVSCTEEIHASLARKDLLPGRHLVDAGYVDADLVVQSQVKHSVELLGPTRYNPSWQAREGGYDLPQFRVEWDAKRAICPEGKTSISWTPTTMKPYGYPVVHVRFAKADCQGCPSRGKCVRSESGRPRALNLRAQEHYEALQGARERIASAEGKRTYRLRAGVESTHAQAVRRSGLRQCRYVGLAKTHLQHLATAAALNLVRSAEFLAGVQPAATRVSRFARLQIAPPALA
jgi:transposase